MLPYMIADAIGRICVRCVGIRARFQQDPHGIDLPAHDGQPERHLTIRTCLVRVGPMGQEKPNNLDVSPEDCALQRAGSALHPNIGI